MKRANNITNGHNSEKPQSVLCIRKYFGGRVMRTHARASKGRFLSKTLNCSAAKLGLVGILAFATAAQGRERIHTIPFFPSMSDTFLDGIARVINHSGEAGEIRISAFDDEGESYGPVVLSIAAAATVHLTSDDLETGNTSIGLSGSYVQARAIGASSCQPNWKSRYWHTSAPPTGS